MPNPAIVSDVADRWRPLSSDEQQVAQALLADAWAILTTRLPELESRMATGVPSEQLVTSVVTAMVLRVLKNPEGKREESIDDYSWTRDKALSGGELYVTAGELSLLAPGPRAWSVSLV